ncbi:MAG: undecaprenyl-diphosphate phosphatase [Bacteroidetes bacterium]|nr:undecaprenyl-diphosphate phosphatase [Bacteroidota bacterium]
MSIVDAIVIAVIQGLTEFLPVSSSGHLVLTQYLLGLNEPHIMVFDVMVHFGTLLSLVIVMRKDIIGIADSFFHVIKSGKVKETDKKEYFKLGVAVIIGSIPAGAAGLVFHDRVVEIFTDPKFAAMNIVITGLILFLTQLAKPIEGKKVGIITSMLIGLAQVAAIMPGISRSGITISSALFLNISPIQAARFSFLLSIPVIFGASLLETYNLIAYGITIGYLEIIIGIIVSAASGYCGIKLLMRVLEKGKFSWFSLYCLVIGIIGIFII